MYRPAALILALSMVTPDAWAQAALASPAPPAARRVRPAEVAVRATSGDVTVTTASDADRSNGRALRAGEVLPRDASVRVGEGSTATLRLPNGVALALMPGSEFTLSDGSAASFSALARGAARVTASPRCQRAFPLAVGAATAYLGCGDGVVSAALGGRAARFSVHRGTLRVRATTGEYVVRAGEGVRQEPARRSSTHALFTAPQWVQAPPERATTLGGPVDVHGEYRVNDRRPTSGWRVELARDAAFEDLASVTVLDGAESRWNGHPITPGTWYVRVSAIDIDHFEGPPTAPTRIAVTGPEILAGSPLVAGERGRLAAVRMPPGAVCGLDGARPLPVTEPIRLTPAREHRVRCIEGDAANVHELVIAPHEAGPLLHSVEARATTRNEGLVTLRLGDAEGVAVAYGDVSATAQAGIAVSDFREEETRGVYHAAIFWRGTEPPPAVRLRVTVNGRVSFDTEVALRR